MSRWRTELVPAQPGDDLPGVAAVSSGGGDDRDGVVAVGDVDRSDGWADADGAGRAPGREFRLRVVAAGGSGGVELLALMTEMLVSSILVTTTVRLAGSKAMLEGPKPAVAVGGVRLHPVLVVALQIAPLITDTVPDPSPFSRLAT